MRDMPNLQPSPVHHERHDPLLVARLRDDDLSPVERARVEALLASCAGCRELADDLRLLSRAVAAERVPARPRDFRLTAAQAERVRGSRLQRLLARVTLPDLGLLRPLAGSAMALGLLLIVVGTVVPGPAAPAPEAALRMTGVPEGSQDVGIVADDQTLKAQEPGLEVAPEADVLDMRAGEGPAAPSDPDAKARTVRPEGEEDTESATVASEDTESTPLASEVAAPGDGAPAADAPGDSASDGRTAAVILGALVGLIGLVLAGFARLARRIADPLLR